MPTKYIEKILKSHVYDVAVKTPLTEAPFLSKRLNQKILLKREDLQPVFSFKLRGAYNKIIQLDEESKQRGIIASSAGNHAQGVAFSAQRLGIKALIVMPVTTPPIKVRNVQNLGAKVILHGDTYNDAYEHAQQLCREKNLTFIHPYDDPDVIAGQGTIAKEILEEYGKPIDAIFVPAGGGGLIAGISAYVKYLRPETKVIGVEPDDAACLAAAMAAGKRVELEKVGIFVDGVAVKKVGAEPFRIARKCVDAVITVTTDEVCAAIKDIFDDTRAIAEPAGALALAGLKKYVRQVNTPNMTLVSIISGANINFDRLRHISERTELGEKREAIFAVTIPEKPGSFRHFCKAIGKRSISEFNYRYADDSAAHVFVGIKLDQGEDEKEKCLQELRLKGYAVLDMTDNEMAKLHLRHMVGGRNDKVKNEKVFRFQFPERPGALLQFLSHMGLSWNITMFHYRNHGADYGRVLVGMQLPENEEDQFHLFLKELGYSYYDETDNPAYKLFL